MRQTCYTCLRPSSFCNCKFVKNTVANAVHLHILQHPHERMHPFGTVRLLRLGLKNLELEICYNDLRSKILEFPEDTALLYPGKEAVTLEGLPPEKYPKKLIVLDGTWSQAKALYKSNPQLWNLPHYQLQPTTPGQYRIRKEPKPHCLSTLEAVVQSLQILEPEKDFTELLTAFTGMIDEQIAYSATHERLPRRTTRKHSIKLVSPNSVFSQT